MDRSHAAPAKSSHPPVSFRRAMALWLALLALTVQAFAPAAHARILQRFANDQTGGYVVICAADGLRVIELDALTAPDAGDGKAVGFHLPFDVQTKAGKHACCLVAGVPAVAPDAPDILPPVRAAHAAAPPRAQGPQLVDGIPPERPGHPRDPPAFRLTVSS
jgi:hypothetical protein